MRLTPADRCFARIRKRAQRSRRVGDHQPQHSIQFAIVRVDALPPQSLKVLENSLDPADRFVRPFHVYGVRSKVDPDSK